MSSKTAIQSTPTPDVVPPDISPPAIKRNLVAGDLFRDWLVWWLRFA